MRILVTGGAGFVGSHLVDRLIAQGHWVTVVDNYITGSPANIAHLAGHPRVLVVDQDIAQPWSADITRLHYDRVYNLASPASPRGYMRHPIETLMVNSIGTRHALELARHHGARFVQASTSEIYGDPLVHPQPESYWGNVNTVGPRSCYDEGKRFSESLVHEYVAHYGVDARIARIFNTYGPRCHPLDGRVVPNFCIQALEQRAITVYGSGTQTRAFCYVADLVRGLELLMETDDIAGEAVNLGNPNEQTILEFAERIIAITGSASSIRFEPLPTDDPRRRQPDISKAERLLGWRPEVSLDEGLQRTIDWYAANLPAPLAAQVHRLPVPAAGVAAAM